MSQKMSYNKCCCDFSVEKRGYHSSLLFCKAPRVLDGKSSECRVSFCCKLRFHREQKICSFFARIALEMLILRHIRKHNSRLKWNCQPAEPIEACRSLSKRKPSWQYQHQLTWHHKGNLGFLKSISQKTFAILLDGAVLLCFIYWTLL